jgi:sugar phosphate isomerase/epimerase
MSLSRRDFLNLGAMTGTFSLINNLQSFAQPMTFSSQGAGFGMLIFATSWGYTGSWEEFASKIKGLGYDGAELWFPSETSEQKEVFSAFEKNKLSLGFLVSGSDRDPQKHFDQFKFNVDAAEEHKPVYINCHSGRDYFSFNENRKFIDHTIKLSQTSGVPIYHETHRSRILYAAPVAREFIQTLPGLRITLDISHWCNVHESLLADQADTLAMTLERVDHIHARIGHAEGPQVNDPRAPEWKEAVEAHFAWWDTVVSRKKREGKLMTFLTEFGPVDYMPALPYTRQPVADQWQINKHMLDTLRTRYT